MTKNKNNQAIWGARIKSNISPIFQKAGSSINIDKRLYREDIAASIAHVEMLFRQKIISFKIKNKIVYGLNKIEKEISKKKFQFNKKYEDIHLNIEKRLFQIIGDEAGYLHIARSRNDQVITDFKIWIRSASKKIIIRIDNIIKSSLKQAEKNVKTITSMAKTKLYQNPEKSENSCTKPLAAVDVEKPANVIGINIIACAKIIGITPAALILSGIYCLAPAKRCPIICLG